MEIVAALLVALFVFFLVKKLASKRTGARPAAPVESAVERWARGEVARLLADALNAEEADVVATLGGNPDPDLVSSIAGGVRGVEIVYERAPGEPSKIDCRVEVRLTEGHLERSMLRFENGALPEDVKEEFAKTGAAQLFRPFVFPWDKPAA
ncbi:MAG: hypothetical protein U0271_13635 [Polyangiaceae bacterium]